MCTSCPVQFRGQTGQLFYFTKCLKSYLSCFCIKAITATISTHKSHIQLNASKVTILPPPHARQAVFIPSCAVQNSVDYSPLHILPHHPPFAHIFLEIFLFSVNLPHNTLTDFTRHTPNTAIVPVCRIALCFSKVL